MTESDRITALETKVDSLECRMTKLESSDETRTASFSSIDTKLQLLGQKFDTFYDSLEKREDSKKFNWSQVLAVLGIIVALGATIWATNYTVKQTLQSNNSTVSRISEDDLNTLTESVLDKIKDSADRANY